MTKSLPLTYRYSITCPANLAFRPVRSGLYPDSFPCTVYPVDSLLPSFWSLKHNYPVNNYPVFVLRDFYWPVYGLFIILQVTKLSGIPFPTGICCTRYSISWIPICPLASSIIIPFDRSTFLGISKKIRVPGTLQTHIVRIYIIKFSWCRICILEGIFQLEHYFLSVSSFWVDMICTKPR
jgi:hypothetical protein